MKKLHTSLWFCAVCLVLTACLSYSGIARASTSMPNFVLERVTDGVTVDSQEFEGNALLITFFATWCPPCVEEIPTLIELQEKFSDQGFSVVGLSVDQGGPGIVAKLVKKRSINYPVLMADSETMQKFGGVYGIPVSFLVNKEGNVVKKYTGYVPANVLISDIQSIIN